MNSRAIAASIILEVLQGRSLNYALEKNRNTLSIQDKKFIQAICYGVLREHEYLKQLSNKLLKNPKKTPPLILALIFVGLYQIEFLSTPTYASVNATVNACQQLKQAKSKSLVNAILRTFLRDREKLLDKCDINHFQYSAPKWWIRWTQKHWPEDWKDILDAARLHPKMQIRVNLSKTSRKKYLSLLAASNIESFSVPTTASGIELKSPTNVENLPKFEDGFVSVQGTSAQFAASLLNTKPGDIVLDACAAPGSKTCHLLEQHPLEVTALEIDALRCERIQSNLSRLNLTATVMNIDALKAHNYFEEEYFDRILIDAPCSGSGVIHHHPDIKLLRTQADFKKAANRQFELLQSLWPLLKKGGKLLYATCSIHPYENDLVLKKFLGETQDANIEDIYLDVGIKTSLGRQILPSEHWDGFYYGLLVKDG